MPKKSGILVVSTGTSDFEARRKGIEGIEKAIGQAFQGYEVRRAFTSARIIGKIKLKEGILIDTPKEALEKMAVEGFDEVVVQPLYLIPGIEYERAASVIKSYEDKFEKFYMGKPVLCTEEDYIRVVKILKAQFSEVEEDQAVMLVGHGSSHECNSCYHKFQEAMDREGTFIRQELAGETLIRYSVTGTEKLRLSSESEALKLNKNIFTVTLKDSWEIYDMMNKLRERKIEKVLLAPFMVTAGKHALEDIISDKAGSVRSLLEEEGFTVSAFTQGLGENTEYQRIYIDRIEEMLKQKNY